eukprot:7334797-Pyramimonas_sp.AAC.1
MPARTAGLRVRAHLGAGSGNDGDRRSAEGGFIGQVQTPSSPQNPTKSEEYRRRLQGVLYIV